MKMRPLKSSAAFEAFVVDQLAGLGEVTPKKMFGGVGLYCDGVFFGIIARDVLYLKADGQTRARFEAAGATPFRPYPNRAGKTQYYSVALEVLESAPDLERWARDAVKAGRRAAGS